MRIQPDEKKIRSFTNTFWKEGRRVLKSNTARLIEMIGDVPIEDIKNRAPRILDTWELRSYLIDIWSTTGAWFANDMTRKLMTRQVKAEEYWEDAFRRYMEARVAGKAMSIARTEATMFNSLIDLIIQEGYQEGFSINEITGKLKREIEKRMGVIQQWEAQRIAQTEVIGSANKGSFDGAMSTGLDIQKGWLTSGLQNVRATHALYGSMDFQPMDYEYAYGLQFPGDPRADPSEIINCHCAIIYNVD